MKTYAEEPWNPVWEYELKVTRDFTETCTVIRDVVIGDKK